MASAVIWHFSGSWLWHHLQQKQTFLCVCVYTYCILYIYISIHNYFLLKAHRYNANRESLVLSGWEQNKCVFPLENVTRSHYVNLLLCAEASSLAWCWTPVVFSAFTFLAALPLLDPNHMRIMPGASGYFILLHPSSSMPERYLLHLARHVSLLHVSLSHWEMGKVTLRHQQSCLFFKLLFVIYSHRPTLRLHNDTPLCNFL